MTDIEQSKLGSNNYLEEEALQGLNPETERIARQLEILSDQYRAQMGLTSLGLEIAAGKEAPLLDEYSVVMEINDPTGSPQRKQLVLGQYLNQQLQANNLSKAAEVVEQNFQLIMESDLIFSPCLEIVFSRWPGFDTEKVMNFFEIRLLSCLPLIETQQDNYFGDYCAYCESKGKMLHLISFVEENLEYFLNSDFYLLPSFTKFLENPPHGLKLYQKISGLRDKKIQNDIKRTRQRLRQAKTDNKEREAIQEKTSLSILLHRLIKDYLCLKNDYKKAREVMDGIPEDNIYPEWRIKIQEAIEGLIPPFFDIPNFPQAQKVINSIQEYFIKIERKIDQKMQAEEEPLPQIQITEYGRELTHLHIIHQVCTGFLAALSKQPFANDQQVFLIRYALALEWVELQNISEETKAGAMLQIWKQVKADGVRVLPFANILAARITEHIYKARENNPEGCAKVIHFCEHLPPNVTMLRGTKYYLAKSYLVCASQNPKNIRRALEIIIAELPQFRGSQFETEIWREMILPHFAQHGRGLLAGKTNTEVPLALLSDEPKNREAKLNIILLYLETGNNSEALNVFAHLQGALVSLFQEQESKLDDTLVRTYLRITKLVAQERTSREALAYLESIPQEKKSQDVLKYMFSLCLTPEVIDSRRILLAEELLPKISGEERGHLANQLAKAKENLGIRTPVSVSSEAYLAEAANDPYLSLYLGQKDDSPEKESRLAFIFSGLEDLRRDYLAFLKIQSEDQLAAKIFPTDPNQESTLQISLAEISTFFSRLGVEETTISRSEKNNEILVHCAFDKKHSAPGKRKIVAFETGRRQNATAGKSIPERLLEKIFEIAILETIIIHILGQNIDGLAEFLGEKGNSEWGKIKKTRLETWQKIMRSVSENPSPDFPESSAAYLENIQQTLTRLAEKVPQKSLSDIEASAIIELYSSLIASCRDIGDPVHFFRSRIDPANPLSSHLKYLKIYGREEGANKLEELGIDRSDIERFGFLSDEPNNFILYGEVVLKFSREEIEQRIPVIIDREGTLHIPGMDKENPIRKWLEIAIWESFAFKVVPAIAPLSHLFEKKTGKRKRDSFRITRSPFSEKLSREARIARERRVAVGMIHAENAKSRPSESASKNAFEEKNNALQKLLDDLMILDIDQKPITSLPLYYRSPDGINHRIRGLFGKNAAGETTINLTTLKTLAEFSDIDEDEGIVRLIDLLPDIQKTILEKIVLRSGVESIRYLHVRITLFEEEIYKNPSTGEIFTCRDANRQSKNTIQIGNRLLHLTPLPAGSFLQEINNRTYLVQPFQSSEKAKKAYEESGHIENAFKSVLGVHEIIFDEQGKVIASTFLGEAAQDEKGNYLSPQTAHLVKMHKEDGLVAPFLLNQRERQKLGEQKIGGSALITCSCGRTFVQAPSTSLGEALTSPYNFQKKVLEAALKELSRMAETGVISEEEKDSISQSLTEEAPQEEETPKSEQIEIAKEKTARSQKKPISQKRKSRKKNPATADDNPLEEEKEVKKGPKKKNPPPGSNPLREKMLKADYNKKSRLQKEERKKEKIERIKRRKALELIDLKNKYEKLFEGLEVGVLYRVASRDRTDQINYRGLHGIDLYVIPPTDSAIDHLLWTFKRERTFNSEDLEPNCEEDVFVRLDSPTSSRISKISRDCLKKA